jgi:hypothetical protein
MARGLAGDFSKVNYTPQMFALFVSIRTLPLLEDKRVFECEFFAPVL